MDNTRNQQDKLIKRIWILVIILILISIAFFSFQLYKFNKTGATHPVITPPKPIVENPAYEFGQSGIVNAANEGNLDKAISIGEQLKNSGQYSDQDVLALANAYLQKGSTQYLESEYSKKALEIIDMVLEKNDKNVVALRLKAYSYEIVNDFKNAELFYNKAISADDKNSESYSQRAHMHDLMGNYKKSELDILKALELDNTNEQAIYLNLRLSYMKDKLSIKDAEDFINNSKNIFFKSDIIMMIGMYYLDMKEQDKAIEYINKSISLKPSPANHTALATIYLFDLDAAFLEKKTLTEEESKSHFDKIIKNTDSAIKLYKDYTQAYLVAADLLNMFGMKEIENQMILAASDVVERDISLDTKERAELKLRINNKLK